LVRDKAAFLALPEPALEASEKVATRASSLSLVRYRRNDYSVPTEYAHREVLVKGFVDQVCIACAGELIAAHPRSYAREDFIYNPLHYLALLERKANALDQAAPLQRWVLPAVFDRLRRLLEARLERRGRREYIQVLRLIETFGEAQTAQAIAKALDLGAISFDAVKHLALCAAQRQLPKLNLRHYPYLPQAKVACTDTRDYLSLLLARGARPAAALEVAP
jgi:hypothetical protein